MEGFGSKFRPSHDFHCCETPSPRVAIRLRVGSEVCDCSGHSYMLIAVLSEKCVCIQPVCGIIKML